MERNAAKHDNTEHQTNRCSRTHSVRHTELRDNQRDMARDTRPATLGPTMTANKRVGDGGRLPAPEPSTEMHVLSMDMSGKAGIVTGAARGIGRAIAEGLSGTGAKVL